MRKKLPVNSCQLPVNTGGNCARSFNWQLTTGNWQLSRGFTLIEIMVALTIIAILATIGIFAMKGVVGGNKTNQTKATLGTLRGMLTEYENATHFNSAPLQWEWAGSDGGTGGIVIEPNYDTINHGGVAAPDFWHNPHYNISSAAPYNYTPDPLVAPTSVVVGSPDGPNMLERYGSVAVINTQIVMNLLASLPANKNTLQSTSNHLTDLLQWANTNDMTSISNGGLTNSAVSPYTPIPTLPPSFNFGVCWNPTLGSTISVSGGTPAEVSKNVAYVVGVQVSYTPPTALPGTPPTFWQWKYNPGTASSTIGTNATPSTGANWTVITTAPTPILLDAWGNPIIFVPGSGLLVRSTSRTDGNGKQMPVLIQSPDHKPFFASAGPDGDFSNGDDNVYSFED